MRRTWPLVATAIVLSFGGVYLSGALLSKHMRVPGTPEFLNALCESSEGSHVSCDTVLNSRWGVFPPLPEGESQQTAGAAAERYRFPVAYLGLAYYTLFLAWYVAVGRPSRRSRRWQLLILGVNTGGLLFSAWFIEVMFAELETWCPLCVATHVINLLLFVVNLLLWPRAGAAAKQMAERPDAAEAAADRSARIHPTPRLAMITIVLAAALMRLEYQEALNSRLVETNGQLMVAVKQFRKIDAGLVAQYAREKRVSIKLRDDDPIRYDGKGVPTLVIWGDFECKFCKAFAAKVEGIRKMFDGRLRLVFRHYPLNADCNPHIKHHAHANACKAARLAEAVRLQGGNDVFWQAHDLLFSAGGRLKDVTPELLASRLGLDARKLAADMDSEVVKKRIAEDIEQGYKMGIDATPAAFLDGRFVNNLARDVPGFWRVLARKYREAWAKRQADQEQAAAAQSPNRTPHDAGAPKTGGAAPGTGATPGSPGQPGAR